MLFFFALLAFGLGTLVTAVRGSLTAFVPLAAYVGLLFLSLFYDSLKAKKPDDGSPS
jgi:hypothetical protein